ncbi:hypothetical protein SBRCBS47491_004167 [Sporothrix bragantina]|uniref:Uncharacterized protein n=1 Tax=Sporothrix bragantina TaxID=671064 RepID=A0ABP0BLA9_9PEZI
MSGFSNVLKNGWHPDKDKDFKKQVTGIWKKDNSEYEARTNHVSRPLSSLRDPDSFGPPPRHVALGGGASPGGTAAMTQHSSAARSSTTHPTHSSSQYAPATSSRPSLPSRSQVAAGAAAGNEDDDRPRSPQPYRMNTTGLSTTNLPPPPTRRDGSGINRSPVPAAPALAQKPAPAPKPAIKAVPPGLPPRLPPRSTPSPNPPSYHSTTSTSAHPPPLPEAPNTGSKTGADSYINQDAVNRLGRAGISVPGLGIGAPAHGESTQQQQPTAFSAISTLAASSNTAPAQATPSPRQTSPNRAQIVNHAPPAAQLGELQARFAKMSTGAGVSNSRTPSRSPARPAIEGSSATAASIVAGKKKPPPPPAKKPGLAAVAGKSHPGSHPTDDDEDDLAPPPIPMATRPQGW